MTVLPTVREQVLSAADRLASDTGSHHLTVSLDRRVGGRPRTSALVVAIASIALVAVVVFAIARGHSPKTKRAEVAASGPGLVAPVLGRGAAWYVFAITQNTSPWQPPSTFNQLAPPPTTVNASTHAVVVTRVEDINWTFRSGDGRGDTRQVGKPRFIGSPRQRAIWRSEGSHPLLVFASGLSTRHQHGFQIGDRTFAYAQLLRLPTDPAAVMRLFPPTPQLPVANQASEITTAIEQTPLPPAARAALFNALAQLHGVQSLGTVRDPLGRRGIAFATTTPGERTPPIGPRSEAGAPLPLRNEWIFDPQTKGLLASETLLLKASPTPGIGIGYPTTWTAYVTSKAVPAATVPPVAPPSCPPGSVQLGLGPPVSPQTGENAYLFTVTNRSSAPCTLDGYPRVILTHNSHSLPFVYRDGGGQYVTSRKPRAVTLRPNTAAYFLVAKYRCDNKTLAAATTIEIAHLGIGGIATVNLSSRGITNLGYCQRAPTGPRVDPGNYITVSPTEPTAGATFPRAP
jgi:hypothetical protein